MVQVINQMTDRGSPYDAATAGPRPIHNNGDVSDESSRLSGVVSDTKAGPAVRHHSPHFEEK
jgi:hypothetical protein